MTTETLKEYIERKHGGVQARFADASGVQRQQVHKWIKGGFIVVDGVLYSPRREIK